MESLFVGREDLVVEVAGDEEGSADVARLGARLLGGDGSVEEGLEVVL